MFLKANARRVVIKIGTNSIARPEGGLFKERLAELAGDCAALKEAGIQPIIVSSGAVGLGMAGLHLKKRPTELALLQACASVGQSWLMHEWQLALQNVGLMAGQVLLTREDVRGRKRHVAIKNTLEQLIQLGVIPVINENDTVSADEIKFSDNDILSALAASLIKADLLVILSTIKGLIDLDGSGELIPLVREINQEIRDMARGPLDSRSTGGMITKIEAAHLATRSGCGVFIADASVPNVIRKVLDGECEGTFFLPYTTPLASKKRWIAFFEKSAGSLTLDEGAVCALKEGRSSLLAKGVTGSHGNFLRGDVVTLQASNGESIGRGICEFNTQEIELIKGQSIKEIKPLIPQRTRYEVVHKDSLVLTGS